MVMSNSPYEMTSSSSRMLRAWITCRSCGGRSLPGSQARRNCSQAPGFSRRAEKKTITGSSFRWSRAMLSPPPARGTGGPMSERRWIVPLPKGAEPPYRVFVNGVPQTEGADYTLERGALVFRRHLEKEGKLGIGRWTAIWLGLFGTYRKNDSVDVQYRVGGEERVATYLDIIPPDAGESANRS